MKMGEEPQPDSGHTNPHTCRALRPHEQGMVRSAAPLPDPGHLLERLPVGEAVVLRGEDLGRL